MPRAVHPRPCRPPGPSSEGAHRQSPVTAAQKEERLLQGDANGAQGQRCWVSKNNSPCAFLGLWV